MFIPWTIEERAARWFPILEDAQAEKGLALMKGVIPFPEKISPSKRMARLERVHAIETLMDIPPDIREDDRKLCCFLAALQMLILKKKKFAQMRLGIYVNMHGRVGKVIRLDRRNFKVTVQFDDFYGSQTLDITEVRLAEPHNPSPA